MILYRRFWPLQNVIRFNIQNHRWYSLDPIFPRKRFSTFMRQLQKRINKIAKVGGKRAQINSKQFRIYIPFISPGHSTESREARHGWRINALLSTGLNNAWEMSRLCSTKANECTAHLSFRKTLGELMFRDCVFTFRILHEEGSSY